MFKSLVSWSEREFSGLPWRRDHDPYKVLVSEIMLQQTTVGTVLNHFERFLNIFPTLDALTLSSEEEVLVAWKGLGYYRRAKNLRLACIDIKENHAGMIPSDLESLLSIRGIGDYTARALLAFSFNKKALAVDANIERVIARFYGLETEKGLRLQREVRSLFETGDILAAEMRKYSPRALNGALMDLGRVYCQARRADCALCPLKSGCSSFESGKALLLPRQKEQTSAAEQKHELALLRVIHRQNGKVAGIRREEAQWLAGQYEIPTYVLETTDEKLAQYPRMGVKIDYGELPSYKTTITKYKITNYILVADASEFKKLKIKNHQFLNSKEGKNLSTASLKALKKIGEL